MISSNRELKWHAPKKGNYGDKKVYSLYFYMERCMMVSIDEVRQITARALWIFDRETLDHR